MSHVLTVKIPHPLLSQIEKASAQEGKSKGALVREAIESFLKGKEDIEGHLTRFRRATEAMLKGKRLKSKVDWEELRRKASSVNTGMTPEEEVLRSRRRWL